MNNNNNNSGAKNSQNIKDEFAIPPDLVKAIRDGSCIAFLGAGFSIPQSLPSWWKLLDNLVEQNKHRPSLRYVKDVLLNKSEMNHRDYWEAAQRIEEAIGRPAMMKELTKQLKVGEPLTPAMKERVDLLRKIPFQGIVTTNFDDTLKGSTIDDTEALQRLCRSVRPSLEQATQHAFLQRDYVPVLKIHGDVLKGESVVLTGKDYRNLLHGKAQYRNFLMTLFLTKTVLFLGSSLTDEYVNEIRSQVIELLGISPDDFASGRRKPLAYVVVNDWDKAKCEYYLRNEGVYVLSYSTFKDTVNQDGSITKTRDFSGFLTYLSAIERQTNPVARLNGMRVLWCHRKPQLNVPTDPDEKLMRYLFGSNIDEAIGVKQGIEKWKVHLTNTGSKYHIVISSWDETGKFLLELSKGITDENGSRAPIIVFAGFREDEEKKKATRDALSLGALGFCTLWTELLKMLLDFSEDSPKEKGSLEHNYV